MKPKFIFVDYDGTLATYNSGDYEKYGPLHLGQPIPLMVNRVKQWLLEGHKVAIFTARAANPHEGEMKAIQQWCKEHIGRKLIITCIKTPDVDEFWDDRAFSVVRNTGMVYNAVVDDNNEVVFK